MIIPPIKYELSTTEQIGSMNFKFEPYIQYYNETTGFWDMILEPFPIKTMGKIIINVCRVILTKE